MSIESLTYMIHVNSIKMWGWYYQLNYVHWSMKPIVFLLLSQYSGQCAQSWSIRKNPFLMKPGYFLHGQARMWCCDITFYERDLVVSRSARANKHSPAAWAEAVAGNCVSYYKQILWSKVQEPGKIFSVQCLCASIRGMPRTRSAFLLHMSLVTMSEGWAGWGRFSGIAISQHDLWTLIPSFMLWTLIWKFDLCKVCFAVAF